MEVSERDVDRYRKDATRTAIDMQYGHKVLVDLENAKTWSEIYDIMTAARKEKSK